MNDQPTDELYLMHWTTDDGGVLRADDNGNVVVGAGLLSGVRAAQAYIVALRAEIEEHRRDLANTRNQLAAERRTVTEHETDLESIAEGLLAEAERRDWCNEYDEWITTMNAKTYGTWLLPCARTRAYEYRFTVTVTGTEAALSGVEAAVTEHLDRFEYDGEGVRDVGVSIRQTS